MIAAQPVMGQCNPFRPAVWMAGASVMFRVDDLKNEP